MIAEPLEEEVYQAIKSGEIPECRIKKNDKDIYPKFIKAGYETKLARSIKEVFNGCILIDGTRGVVHIGEVIELIMDGFDQVIREGPLAKEPCMKLKVTIKDLKLHEDAIHRGPAQVLPAVRESVRGSMNSAGAVIFEPMQILQVECPAEYMGEISRLTGNKRGQLLEVNQEGEHMTIKCKLPVSEMFGLSNDLRSATGGRGHFFVVDQVFERLPHELQAKTIYKIRERKGLKQEDFVEKEEA